MHYSVFQKLKAENTQESLFRNQPRKLGIFRTAYIKRTPKARYKITLAL